MTNYKESTGTSTSWQRAYQVAIDNRLGLTPQITFYEEEAVDMGDGRYMTKHVGHINEMFNDPNTTFNLLNPATGDIIGTSNYMQAYVLLHSIYMYLANLRDNPPVPVEVPSEEPPPEEPPVEP